MGVSALLRTEPFEYEWTFGNISGCFTVDEDVNSSDLTCSVDDDVDVGVIGRDDDE